MKKATRSKISPSGLVQRYRKIFVVKPSLATDNVGPSTPVKLLFVRVQVRKYLMARYHQRSSKSKARRAKAKKFMQQHDAYLRALKKYNRKYRIWKDKNIDARISRCYIGKGLPEDFETALEYAIMAKHCKEDKASVQSYLDKRMGLDCSGFVQAYFVLNGKMKINPTKSSKMFWNEYRLEDRMKASDIRVGDCMNACNSKGSVTATTANTTGHIMLAGSEAIVKGKYTFLFVCESTATAGKGLAGSWYILESVKNIRGGAVWTVRRGKFAKRSRMYVRIYKTSLT